MCYIQVIQTVNSMFEYPLVKGLGALIGLYIVYWLGLRAYFSQKEFENVRLRYLDAGLDMACSQVEYALGVYRSNWQLLLRYTKLCRELKVPFDSKDFFTQFRELDQSKFQITPGHRISTLVPNKVIWNFYQLVFSFVGVTNEKIKADFGSALKVVSKDPNNPIHKGFAPEGEKLAHELDAESKKFYLFLSELNNLAHIFEQQQIKRKDIDSFSKREDVVEIVSRVEAIFPEDN